MQHETPTEAEVDAAVRVAIGDILKQEDPVMRYAALTHKLAVYDRVVSRIADERARCATDLHATGASFNGVAGTLAVGTRARAQQLISRGRKLPGLIFAFRDQGGELYGDLELMKTVPAESARLQFEPADRSLYFAGHLLNLYFGPVDEEKVTPSLYAYTTVGDNLRVRPTQHVHDILFGMRIGDTPWISSTQ